jgi:hypothetical protein
MATKPGENLFHRAFYSAKALAHGFSAFFLTEYRQASG